MNKNFPWLLDKDSSGSRLLQSRVTASGLTLPFSQLQASKSYKNKTGDLLCLTQVAMRYSTGKRTCG